MKTLALSTGVTLAYEIHGERGEPFVLLGGTGSDHALWSGFLPALSERFRVVTPDPRGTGASSRPADRSLYTSRSMAADVAELIDRLELGPCHVAGLSLGAAVAMELGGSRPELVRSLHLHGAWAKSDRWFNAMMDVMEYPLRHGDVQGFLDLALPCILSRTFLAAGDAVAALTRSFLIDNPTPPSVDGLLGHLNADKTHDATPRLGAIRCPTLVATGENDIQVRPEYGRETAAAIPSATFRLIEGPLASHCAILEMPDLFVDWTCRFVDGRL